MEMEKHQRCEEGLKKERLREKAVSKSFHNTLPELYASSF